MIRLRRGALIVAACAATLVSAAGSAVAQTAEQGPAYGRGPGFLENIFGRERRATQREDEGPVQTAQVSSADLVLRLDRLEAQVRQLTGAIEQLQFRNQQLEQQLMRRPEEADGRPSGAPPRGASAPPPPVAAAPAAPPGRRSDAFDPSQNPGAPGAPRALGTARPIIADEEQPVGAPGGRAAGAPLDLATLSAQSAGAAAPPPGAPPSSAGLPPPPPRNPNATGAPTQMVMAPSNTPRDEFDLAYGYILRKDYALAEESFRAYLEKYPSDRRVADATYWLGESLFQRQRYREAAETFLSVTTQHATLAKAPDSLLRLGQSLAALKEKDAACATFAEIGRKYPRASPTVKQSAERELKRVGC